MIEDDGLTEKSGVVGRVNDSQSGIVYGTGGKSASLCANGGGMGAKTGLYIVPGEENKEENKEEIIEAKGITMSGTFGDRKVATSDKAYCLAANPSSDMQPMVEITKGEVGQEPEEEITSGTLRTHKDGNGFREVKSGKGATIPARAREDGSGQNVVKITTVLKEDEVNIFDDYNGRFRTDEKSGTLTRNTGGSAERNGQKLVVHSRIRRLTPVECERLQTFEDFYTDKGISDTQRYKMLGNSWTVEVIKYIFGHLPYSKNHTN